MRNQRFSHSIHPFIGLFSRDIASNICLKETKRTFLRFCKQLVRSVIVDVIAQQFFTDDMPVLQCRESSRSNAYVSL